MNMEIRNFVIDLLENYHRREREIAVLRYEMDHPPRVTHDEVIEAMSFSRSDDSGHVQGHISDKTMYIALNYREKANQANAEIMERVAVRLLELEQEKNKLDYYISLLDKRQTEVIRLFYIDKKPKDEIVKQLGLSSRTIHDVKNAAIDSLTELYCLATGRRL